MSPSTPPVYDIAKRQADAARLAKLEAAFEINGGRGVGLADEIDDLRSELRSVIYDVTLRVKFDPEDPYESIDPPDAWDWPALVDWPDVTVVDTVRHDPPTA